MATSKEEDFTACPICYETFCVPKTLPCLHNLCEGCLQKYITSTVQKNSVCSGIHCPVCRDFVPKPGSTDADKWAKEFPSNHLLVNIIDTYNAKSESRIAESRQCNACARERETVQASSLCTDCCEALCVSCARHHRKQKQSIMHRITDIVKINEPEMPSQSIDFYCTIHPGRTIKAFCYNHSVVCCMECVKCMHRKCDNVLHIDEAAKMMKNCGANLLELWDDNCKQLSTLALPGYPMGIKMTSDTVGAVVILDTALEFFEVSNNTISELKRVDVPVKRDFLYHKEKFYIGGDKKIIVQDSNNKHLRDVPVDNTVGYMCIATHNTLCFTELGGSVLYCITLDGKSKFLYSHEKLRSTHGVTVVCSGNIYVCGYSSGNVHQLNREGELQKIMFDNLHSNPHFISINKDNDKAVIGCHLRVSLYKMM